MGLRKYGERKEVDEWLKSEGIVKPVQKVPQRPKKTPKSLEGQQYMEFPKDGDDHGEYHTT